MSDENRYYTRLHPICSVILLLTTLLIGDASGQQPNTRGTPPPAPLLPAEQAWLRDLPALPAAGGVMDADRVYIPLQEGGTIALARESGEIVWKNPLSGPWPPVLAPGALISVSTDEVAAFDRATGATRWRIPLPSNSIAPAASAGSLTLVALDNGSILAINSADGTTAWSCRLEDLVKPVSLAADADAVYVATGDSQAAAIALSSGTVKWRATLSGALSQPAVGKDRVFTGSTSNAFFALNAGTGKVEWTWEPQFIGGDIIGAAVDGDVAYFVGLDNLLHAVNRGNGNQRWKQATPMRPTAPPVAFGGVVAVFGISPAVATFNARTGAPIGTYSIPPAAGVTATAVPKGPALVDPNLRPFQVAMVAITADGRAVGMRPTELMFREPPAVPLTELPGRTLQRERQPPAPTTK